MKKSRDIRLLAILIIILFAINYPFLDNALKKFLTESETINVDRIIDGDTIESNGTSIRLLGINTPERGEFLYQEAKEFLGSRILNKTVVLKFGKDRYDKYDRTLAYVFLDGENINLELVENGFANYYFYSGKDSYSSSLTDAWNNCINKNVNLCEKSKDVCAQCISVNSSSVINNCSFSCNISNWQIKGEGREKFIFQERVLSSGSDSKFELDLTNSGGTIFLRDEDGNLVVWGN